MIFPIVLYGDPILRKRAEEIEDFDEEIKEFVKSMYETMYAAQGVGLAAPQVGKLLRVFVMDSSLMEKEKEKGIKQVFINPLLIDESGETWAFEEGCLSIPGIRGDVKRKKKIRLKYFDEDGNFYEQEFDNMTARIIQHEYDHLNGRLFTDYMTPLRKKLLSSKLNDISKGKIDIEYRVRTSKR